MTRPDTGLPDDRLCVCGHRVKWFIEDEPDDIDKALGFPGMKIESDVVEKVCPHPEMGHTVTEHCPNCDRRVGRWGWGVAGGEDCPCWDEPLEGQRA